MAPLALMQRSGDSILNKNGEIQHAHEINETMVSSAFTMFTIFPTFQSTTNKRALGQASRYMNAKASKRNKQDLGGRTRGTGSQLFSVDSPDYGSKSLQKNPVDEDETIAESTARMLMDIPKESVPLVSCEQDMGIYLPEIEEEDPEQLWTMSFKGPVRKETPSHEGYCLKPLREYFTKDSAFKARRNCLCFVSTQYNWTRECECCGFRSGGCRKDHMMFMYLLGQDGSANTCEMCNRSGFDPEKLFNHIEGCIL